MSINRHNPFWPLLLFGCLMFFILSAVISHSREMVYLSSVSFKPQSSPYIVGYDLLGQYAGAFSADRSHIKLQYDPQKRSWSMRNISDSGKKLLFIAPNKKEFPANRWQLKDGDIIQLNAHQLQVELKTGTLALHNLQNQKTYHWNAYQLSGEGVENFAGCPRAGWKNGIKRFFRHLTYKFTHSNDNAFTLGGQVQCHDRLALSGVPLNAAKIARDDENNYYLYPHEMQLVQLKRQQQFVSIPPVEVNPDNVFIAGKTRYQAIIQNDDTLTISPVSRIHFFPKWVDDGSDKPKLFHFYQPDNKNITLHSAENRYWHVTAPSIHIPTKKEVVFFILGLLLLLPFSHWIKRACARYQEPTRLVLAVNLTGFFLWFMIYLYIPSEQLANKIYLFLPLWFLATFQVCLYNPDNEKVSRFWWILSALCLVGLLTQLQLAAGSLSSRWYIYANNQIKFSTSLFFLLLLIVPIPKENWLHLTAIFYDYQAKKMLWYKKLLLIIGMVALMMGIALAGFYLLNSNNLIFRLLLAILIFLGSAIIYRLVMSRSGSVSIKTLIITSFVLAILAQGILGSEEGIGGVQPIELAKPLLVWLLCAVMLRHYYRLLRDPAIYRGWQKLPQRVSYYIGPVFASVCVSLFGVGIGVSDYSPLVIVSLTIFGYLWLYLNPLDFKVRKLVYLWRLVFIVSIIGGIYLLFRVHNLPAEEVAKYAGWIPQYDRILIWLSPWNYPDSGRQLQLALSAVHGNGQNWLGVNTFGMNGNIQSLPAVQDDFALAFYLYKFGGIAGVILLFLQFQWLKLLLQNYRQGTKSASNRAYQEQHALLFLAYSLFGFAIMQFAHWAISWGNTLGLLPIMGQPMTFLSTGNSHLFALALPTAIFTYILAKLNPPIQR